MACKTSYELHHNFPKIADEAGFTFNTHRPRIRIDWNKIRIIEVENLIRERKFTVIEQHLNDILDCVLESEFDVRILDEGVMKMFRLAQLAVEYQQFCRHYLDRSVYVLREEINSLAQELDVTKRELKEKDEENRKLKRKTKHTYRTPLPYGNDNIASMILKTLTNKSELFPTCSTGDSIQYNRCSYCDKVFLNQLYLKSHILRRHPNVVEIPSKDLQENVQIISNHTENNKLTDEILELKIKLKEMEDFIKSKSSKPENIKEVNECKTDLKHTEQNITPPTIIMKDAEVSTTNEISVLDKIEEWKKEEQAKYNKEINLLRTQIMETIQTLKEKEVTAAPSTTNNEVKIIEQLNTTISKQGSEILALKQELIDSRIKIEKEEAERRKESDAQMMVWVNRAETHAKQYEILLQKLNDVAREAQGSRAQAEAERERVAQLEAMLQQSTNRREINMETEGKRSDNIKKNIDVKKTPVKKKTYPKAVPEANRQVLEKLHQKAQALLNLGSSSSSSSDISSTENIKLTSPKSNGTTKNTLNNKQRFDKDESKTNITSQNKIGNHVTPLIKERQETKKIKGDKIKKEKNKSHVINNVNAQTNGPILTPRSPMKVVRAKITEEVNNRLITAGVDPLKRGVPRSVFRKQRMQLQQQVELKYKKNPSHEKVRHSILTFLDSSVPKKVTMPAQDYVSPNRVSKAFSLTSVISNVKSKALSLVKHNDVSGKDKRKSLNAEVSKRAMSLLKTPPDSETSSPIIKKAITNEFHLEPKSNIKRVTALNKSNELPTSDKNKKLLLNSSHRTVTIDNETDDDSNASDHKYYKAVIEESSKSIETLIKSPARRPLSATSDYNHVVPKYTISDDSLLRSQSATNIYNLKPESNLIITKPSLEDKKNSSEDESSENSSIEEEIAKENTPNNPKQTKGVLKNASSISSLNKKKVLFDMDAIQMKSLSASPSQSITEKSDGNEKYELGLINLDGEEWDISSIENEPLKNDTKLQINTRTSPKIAELKQTIELQLARRNETPSTAIVGGVDVLAGRTMQRASSVGGSNTSLGSSILDDSESLPPVVNHKAFVKPKPIAPKDDSEIDLSEFSTDGMIVTNKNDRDAF